MSTDASSSSENFSLNGVVGDSLHALERIECGNWNDPLDFRQLEYTTPYDPNLECPICRCPFIDPVMLADCDHCFCRECIRQTWSRSAPYDPLGLQGACPSCRSPARLRPHVSNILVNILDDLIVSCPNAAAGCTLQLKRAELRDHTTIYCGYAMVACPAQECPLSQHRKDSSRGCLHHGVSCMACHTEMQLCDLESHWERACKNSTKHCERCGAIVPFANWSDHDQNGCEGALMSCPGQVLGCNSKEPREQAKTHARSCALAKMAPLMAAQKLRLDEQEIAQKAMSRKLGILENGFAAMNHVLFSSATSRSHMGPDTVLDSITASRLGSEHLGDGHAQGVREDRLQERVGLRAEGDSHMEGNPDFPVLEYSGFSPDSQSDRNSPNSIPRQLWSGPYSSPFHHLLSMHESLRDEMSRMHAALQELDGRQSLQILNENLRTREDVTYLGAQVAGLSRQVHWLTSAQLQRSSTNTSASGASASDLAVSGQGVDVALSAVDSAIRSAARLVETGRQGIHMRRRSSEEGRTKL